MDWYYPVLGGVVLGDAGRARLEERRDTFVMEDRGVRCVSDRPWLTVAETCECALAHLAVGDRDTAEMLFGWEQQFRHAAGRYRTGPAFPDADPVPGGAPSPYTQASVILPDPDLPGTTPARPPHATRPGHLPTPLGPPQN